MNSPGKHRYEFAGEATVSVTCYVEAENEEEAFGKILDGDVTWECDHVDGEVENIELMGSDEDE